MILRKLILENFRQIYGKHEITFALPGSRNVTVVLGQNGAGKTTILNSFLWCLYDRLDMENSDEIVCHRAVQDIPIGGKISAEVSILFQDGIKSYFVKRRVSFQKLDGGKLDEIGIPEFRIDITESNGVTNLAPDPKQLVQQLLPFGLYKFFFFRGEDMEALAGQNAAKDIQTGVSEFLNFDMLKRAIKDLDRVGKLFEDELRVNAVGDVQKISDDIAYHDEESSNARAALDHAENIILALENDRDKTEEQLAASEEARPLLEEKTKLRNQKNGLEESEENERRQLATIISRDGFLWKANEILKVPVQLANEAIKRGELPAKIKPKFVDDILASGNCICGRAFDDLTKNTILQWRGATGLDQHEEAINILRNAAGFLQNRRERLRIDLAAQRLSWSKAKDDIRKNVELISKVETELEGKEFDLNEIKAAQAKLRKINDDLREAASNKRGAKDKLDSIQKKLEELRADRDRKAKEDEKTKIIQTRFNATENVILALKQMHDQWLLIVQEYIDGQLKKNWRRVAQLDRLVEFTHEFRLAIKEKGPDNTWITSAPSSANRRALSLCFVSALIKLASDIRDEKKRKPDDNKRPQMFVGGEYPLVMDAPFASMDYFKKTVPPGLKEIVPQVVILTNSDQWKGEVEESLHNSVGKAYILELHLPANDEITSTVGFCGGISDYVVGEKDAVTDWSVIREVPV